MKPVVKYELFNQFAVKAFLDGRKLQTRRPILDPFLQAIEFDKICSLMNKPPFLRNGKWVYELQSKADDTDFYDIKPKYQVGDIMGIRERARLVEASLQPDGEHARFKYEADGAYTFYMKFPERLKPLKIGNCCPNGCFKELVRIFNKVIGVRVERFCDISWRDCVKEGLWREADETGGMWYGTNKDDPYLTNDPYMAFKKLIESIYPGMWESWVFVYDLERCEKPSKD